MPLKLRSLTLNTARTQEMVDFYRAVGIELEKKQVEKGGVIFKGMFSKTELNIMGIPRQGKISTPDLALQFEVKSLADCQSRLQKLAGVQILLDRASLPYGQAMIVLDPDGHSVELVEPWPEQSEI